MPDGVKPRLSLRPIDRYYVGRVEDEVLQHLVPATGPGSKVVDAGCGWGEKTEALRALGFEQAHGIEYDPVRVAQAQIKYPACTFSEGSITEMPLPDASVDAMFSNSVLQYVDHNAAVAEYARILKPGGRLVLIENLRYNPIALLARLSYRLGALHYTKYMTPRQHVTLEIRDVLHKHGFHVDTSRAFNLLTPLRLAGEGIADSTKQKWMRRWLPSTDSLANLDHALLNRIPVLRRACWTVYVGATKS